MWGIGSPPRARDLWNLFPSLLAFISTVSGNPEFVVACHLIVRAWVEHRPRSATVGDLTKLFDPLRVRVFDIERQVIP